MKCIIRFFLCKIWKRNPNK